MENDPLSALTTLLRLLWKALTALPDVQVTAHSPGPGKTYSGYDAEISLRTAGATYLLVIEAKKGRTLYPRDAREGAWQLRRVLGERAWDAGYYVIPVLAAEAISTGARADLERERIGYFDSGGSLFLCAPGLYAYIDRPPPKMLEKAIRAIYSGRRAQVLHALLMMPGTWHVGAALANWAQVSTATVSQVMTELERLGWVSARGLGPNKERYLVEPGALLDTWVQVLPTLNAPVPQYYYVPDQPGEPLAREPLAWVLGRACAQHNVDYAVTGVAGAQCYAPYISFVATTEVRLLADVGINFMLIALGARPVTEGANLVLIAGDEPGELRFGQSFNGLQLASPVQVYLDLHRSPGRAEDMAKHLRTTRLGF